MDYMRSKDGDGFEVLDLRDENDRLRGVAADALALLERFCDAQDERGRDCPAWPDHDLQCELRDIEGRMRGLGMEVPR